jgi:hypothetical protein
VINNHLFFFVKSDLSVLVVIREFVSALIMTMRDNSKHEISEETATGFHSDSGAIRVSALTIIATRGYTIWSLISSSFRDLKLDTDI